MSAMQAIQNIYKVRVHVTWKRNLGGGLDFDSPEYDEERDAYRVYNVADVDCIEDAIKEAESLAEHEANPVSRFDGVSALVRGEAASWQISTEATHVAVNDGPEMPVKLALRAA